MKEQRILKISRIACCILAVILFHNVNAQAAKLTLDKAISTAVVNNRETKIALMEIDKARARVDEAFGYALPTVTFNANFYHYIQKAVFPFPDFRTMLQTSSLEIMMNEGLIPRDNSRLKPPQTTLQAFVLSNNYEAKAEATQIIFNAAVFRGIGASKIYLDAAREAYRSSVSKTVLNVKKAFYGVLFLQNLLDVVQSSLDNAEDNLANVKAMYKQGLASEYLAMQVQVQVENIKPKIIELRNSLQAAKDGLKILLGYGQDMNIEVDGILAYSKESAADKTKFVNAALASNYDIKTLANKLKVDEAMVDINGADYWPTIAAFGNYSYGGQSDDLNFLNYDVSTVGINFSINLFQGGRTKNKVQQSQIAYQQTEQQLQMLKDYVESQVNAKLMDIKRVSDVIDAQQSNVRLAQRAYDLAVIRFKEGSGTQLEIKNADNQLNIAKSNVLKSIHDFVVAKAELENLAGKVESKYLALPIENK